MSRRDLKKILQVGDVLNYRGFMSYKYRCVLSIVIFS